MRVNEVISRCRTDQKVLIYYDEYHIYGRIYDIIDTQEYRENRIGDWLVTDICVQKINKVPTLAVTAFRT